LIKRNNTNYYLAEGTNTVSVKNMSTLTSANVTEDMVWQFESGGTNNYYIKTIDPNSDTQYYMQAPTNSSVALSPSKPASSFAFSTSGSNIRMRYNSGSRYYISTNGTTVFGATNGNSRDFTFYPVTIGAGGGTSKEETVVLKTIDDVTSQVSKVQNIKRNDFIDVLVTVSYVPDSENGYFKFVVDGWRKKEFDIEFE
ncbi:MAG: hypothetical protein IJY78_02385, partial [Bacteroidaceae bacterium]|nr:hypothetical protein [Bacteroidaceae bacterium]